MNKFSSILSGFNTPDRSQGWWITFEGIEGCGKSTQIKKLHDHLTQKGFEVLHLREPGGTVLGEELRNVILNHPHDLNALSETFIFLASRAELLSSKILPWLNSPKKVVLMDRYLDSTLIYQGWSKKRSFEDVLKLHQFAPLNHLPHLTFLLEISPELSLTRQEIRNNKKDYFESRGEAFLQSLSEGYEQLKEIFPERICALDGSQSIDKIQSEIMTRLNL